MRELFGNNQIKESVNDIYNRISFGQFKFIGKNSTNNVDFVNWTFINTSSSEARNAWQSEEHIGTYDYIQVNFLDKVCSSSLVACIQGLLIVLDSGFSMWGH